MIATSDASGTATTHSYSPTGEQSGTWGSTAPIYRYTGQAALPVAQLYFYKARIYDASLGRFLQTDPIGYQGGMNLYACTHNDPVNFRDPSGLDGCGTGPTFDEQGEHVTDTPCSFGGGGGGGGTAPGSSPSDEQFQPINLPPTKTPSCLVVEVELSFGLQVGRELNFGDFLKGQLRGDAGSFRLNLSTDGISLKATQELSVQVGARVPSTPAGIFAGFNYGRSGDVGRDVSPATQLQNQPFRFTSDAISGIDIGAQALFGIEFRAGYKPLVGSGAACVVRK